MGGTIIIGFAEALSAPEVAWSLVDAGFTVVAFTRAGRRSALRHSRFVRVFQVTAPEVDAARTMEDLRSAILRLNEGAGSTTGLMPLDDTALWLCSRMDLPRQTLLIGPAGRAAEIALDKRRQVEVAAAAGFAVPEIRVVQRAEEALRGGIDFPVVFKPALATALAGNGAGLQRGHNWLCADANELAAAVKAWGGREPMLLQHFVPGVGEGLFGLATRQGVVTWSGHRRLRMMNPQGSGSSACTVVTNIDPLAKAAGERFLVAIEWRGLFMIELLRDAAGKLWFIEFNGRAWGSMALARKCGLEYPAWAAAQAFAPDASFEFPQARKSAAVCRHFGREFLYLLFVLRGSRSKAAANWPSIWRALFDVLRIGRNDRWYNWRRDDPRVFLSDCFVTVRDQLIRPKSS